MNKFKRSRENSARERGGFGRGNFDRPRFGRQERPRFDEGRREHGQAFQAVCSQCGKSCEVPFRPDGRKPVYCGECFSAQRRVPSERDYSSPRERVEKPFAPRVEFRDFADLKLQLNALHTKVDSILKLLERKEQVIEPSSNKPTPIQKTSLEDVIKKNLAKPAKTRKKPVTKKVAKKQ